MFKALLLASRPKTLPASAGPVILGLALAYNLTNQINSLTAILTLITAIILQVSTNLVNDYYDGIRGIDDDKRLGPTRVTSTGILGPSLLKRSFIITFSIAFLLGIYLMFIGGLPIVAIGLSSIFFAYAYTGGPIPLSYYGLGELLALIFFGPVAVWGTFYIQTGSHHNMALIAGLAPGFISAAIMAINNLRDRETDAKTTKVTLAILLGEKGARALPIIFVLFSTFVPIVHSMIYKSQNIILSATFTSYFFMKTWIALSREPISKRFNIYLANTGKYLFIFCLIYSISLIYEN